MDHSVLGRELLYGLVDHTIVYDTENVWTLRLNYCISGQHLKDMLQNCWSLYYNFYNFVCSVFNTVDIYRCFICSDLNVVRNLALKQICLDRCVLISLSPLTVFLFTIIV